EIVFLDLLAQRVAVDLQVLGRAGEVAAMLLEDAGDEFLLELPLRVVEQDPLFDHFRDERFQLLLHGISCSLSRETDGCAPCLLTPKGPKMRPPPWRRRDRDHLRAAERSTSVRRAPVRASGRALLRIFPACAPPLPRGARDRGDVCPRAASPGNRARTACRSS